MFIRQPVIYVTLLHALDAERTCEGPSSDTPHLADLLSDQLNVLSILGLTQVQYTLSQLHTSHPGSGENDVTRVKVIQALGELAGKHEKYRKEIMARGKRYLVILCLFITEILIALVHDLFACTSKVINMFIIL
jgi:hypothetical protein